MLRTKLLAATAVATLMAAPALAQEATPPAQTTVPEATTSSTPQTMPAPAEAAPQAAPQAGTETPAAGETVVDVLRASGQFSTLLSALDQAQLTETLSTRPAISIFAPTDAAFAALPEAERTRLMDPANANELRQVLLYHVIVADVTPDQIEGRKGGVPTASEAQILLDGTGEAIKADGATVVSAELDASNGAVFPIDKVLNPAQSMAAMGDEESATATEAGEASGDDAAATETATPAEPGMTAPNGQPAATATTVASPPVANPTDGQMDSAADPAVNPSTTPPIQTPDAVDGDQEGDPTPQ
ncbi:MAG: fasciclin domain-containing protein [Brevundimonas sp.]|uniref:fasciclin domain-containing protein n=1 Tax=Brevundimonas sp. TaxID=1871086 RepID=UPI002583CA94|nr:fasciclin domain-containing protein [Brevundimonas sp.]MCV0414439.1 fasciclin domain-containing protein [Brevundimonas sp.]